MDVDGPASADTGAVAVEEDGAAVVGWSFVLAASDDDDATGAWEERLADGMVNLQRGYMIAAGGRSDNRERTTVTRSTQLADFWLQVEPSFAAALLERHQVASQETRAE